MSNGKSLDLALRIKADLKQGQAALDELGGAVADVGDKAVTTSAQLNKVGEAADQQAARIQAMVAASLKQQAAQDSLTSSTQRSTAATQAANTSWQATAAAQSASINSYHNAERAVREKAAAEQHAAEQAAKATAEANKQDAALRKLLGSIDSTQRSMSRLDQQEEALNKHYREGRIELAAYNSSLDKIRNKRDALGGIGNEAKTANTAMTGLAASVRSVQRLLLTGVAGYGVTSASRAIVNTSLQWQQAQYTMEAATGSAATARQELEYVREVSERLGLELLSTSQSYARLVAAAKETPELGKSLHTIFEGVSSATTALHLTKEQTNGIMLAMEQMVSKGKVQTTELVLQLGQRVPGAYALAAKALGTNTQQLNQWLEKGMIPAADFLPRFGAALQDAYGPASQQAAGGLNAEINRLTNAMTELKIEAGQAGFIDSFTNAVRELQTVLKDPAVRDGLNTLITALGKLMEYGAKGVGGVAGLTKWAAEEWAARFGSGPAGDDPVRIEQAIERKKTDQQDAEKSYLAAIDGGYQQSIIDGFERKMNAAQTEVARLQQMLDQYNNPPAPTASATKPVVAPAAPAPAPFKPTGDDPAAKRLVKQNEEWVKQLEKEAATYGQGKAALREYELNQHSLTGALKARAEAAWVTLDAAEKQKKADQQAAKDVKTLAQLQLDYLRASGQNVDAAGAEIEKKYGALQKRLQEAGNTEGAGLVSKLINIEQAKAELDQLSQMLDGVFSEQSRREQTINTQQQAGLISELGARQQILDLNKLTADQVEKLLPKMRELAAVTGDPAAIERVKDLEARLGALRVVANEFTNALKAGFETGMQNALQGLASGTMDLREAATAFIQDIASAMAGLASQNLAKMASDSLSGLFSSGAEAATETVAATATGTAITTASMAGATAMGTGITTAGGIAAQAMYTAIVAAGTVKSGSDSTSSFLSAAAAALGGGGGGGAAAGGSASYTGAFGFATGGQVLGPGTGTSDSIPAWLSNTEFVTRAAVVTQPGALGFLHDFNARGMAALDDWARAVHHSTGGLAGVPAPALPRPSLGNGRLADTSKAMSATLKNQQNFYLVDDPSRIADAAFGTRQGIEGMVVAISKDPARFRSILGINN